MTHGSLFSGIGGFDLAAQWIGWDNLFHCEWNEFGQKVLKYYWPDAELFTDITKSDFTKYANRIDILSGGFPCQPYSHAGKRLGKEDERHLWPEMLRAIREIQPSWVVGENVSGLISWNGGLVFNEVQTDLEAEGYEVWPVVLPACAVNAPHRRDRIWFIAHTNGSGGKEPKQQQPNLSTKSGWSNDETTPNPANIGHESSGGTWAGRAGFKNGNSRIATNPDGTKQGNYIGANDGKKGEIRGNETGNVFGELRSDGDAADTCKIRLSGSQPFGKLGRKQRFAIGNEPNTWQEFPTKPPIRCRNDGLSNRLDGITFSKWRNESIKAYGNAIVPQVAFQIFKAIHQMEANPQKQ